MSEEKWAGRKFTAEEDKCLEKFIKFSKLPSLKRYFAITAATEYGTICDFVAENRTGGTVVVESKNRKADALKYSDCFIEVKKYHNLMGLYEKGCLPMYLNTFEDCEDYYLWILPSVPVENLNTHNNVKIKTPIGEKGYKVADRFGLKWCNAWIFDKRGKIKQRPFCEENVPDKPTKHNIDFNDKIDNNVLNKL